MNSNKLALLLTLAITFTMAIVAITMAQHKECPTVVGIELSKDGVTWTDMPVFCPEGYVCRWKGGKE